jgi:uncharacterized protein (TIGR03067 family)
MFMNKVMNAVAAVLLLCGLTLGGGFMVLGYDGVQEKPVNEGAKDKPAPAVKAKTDQDLLQGTWQVVSIEFSGETRDHSDKKYTFRGGRVIEDRPQQLDEGTFKVETTKNPKCIDFTLGEFAPRQQLGIYKVDGDRLLICWGNAADQRPTDFVTDKKAKTFLYRLERVTGDSKATDPEAPKYSEARRRCGSYLRQRVHSRKGVKPNVTHDTIGCP